MHLLRLKNLKISTINKLENKNYKIKWFHIKNFRN